MNNVVIRKAERQVAESDDPLIVEELKHIEAYRAAKADAAKA
jgi:hypothetical protein